MRIEKANLSDIPQIHKLVNYFADKGEMLHRPLSELYENVRDYYVVRREDRIVGCGALHINWSDLAEVKALAVQEDLQAKGIGTNIVEACLGEAKQMGLSTVYTLTYKPRFFERLKFQIVDVAELPRKVWGECFRCPKFPDCDEIALVYHMKKG